MSRDIRWRGRWPYIRCSGCGAWTRSYARPPLCRLCVVAKARAAKAADLNDPNQKLEGLR